MPSQPTPCVPVTCSPIAAAAPPSATDADAEGRLVLADAMAYAVSDELDPAVLVDVATLTGAIKRRPRPVQTGGYFARPSPCAAKLYDAGAAAGEPLWRMPLEADYEDTLKSSVADAHNSPGGPGAVTAALFLQHFAGSVPWARLDLASVGDSPKDSFEMDRRPLRLRRPGAVHLAHRPRPPGRHRLAPLARLAELTGIQTVVSRAVRVGLRASSRRGHPLTAAGVAGLAVVTGAS